MRFCVAFKAKLLSPICWYYRLDHSLRSSYSVILNKHIHHIYVPCVSWPQRCTFFFLCLKVKSFIFCTLASMDSCSSETQKGLENFVLSGTCQIVAETVCSCFVCRWYGHQSEEPVGEERGRGHGRTATWMIFVQRGCWECFRRWERRSFYGSFSLCEFNLSLSFSRRPLSCPLWSLSWKSSGSLWLPWWRRMLAQRSRTSDHTSLGTST